MLASVDFEGGITLNMFVAWMDEGSITLYLVDNNSIEFSVEFCQIMVLKRYPDAKIPGAFLINNDEIPIRSLEESKVLNALKQLRFSSKIEVEEKDKPEHVPTYRKMIGDCIDFVESNEYLTIAKEMGRL